MLWLKEQMKQSCFGRCVGEKRVRSVGVADRGVQGLNSIQSTLVLQISLADGGCDAVVFRCLETGPSRAGSHQGRQRVTGECEKMRAPSYYLSAQLAQICVIAWKRWTRPDPPSDMITSKLGLSPGSVMLLQGPDLGR